MSKVNKKNKTANKFFEFLTVFSMIFGLVVGSGIYLKNSSESGGVLDRAEQNPYLAIAVWVFLGVMCSIMMLTYIEIASSSKKGEHATMQSWANKFFGRRTASFFSIFYIVMYIPVMITIGGMFIIEIQMQAIKAYYENSHGIGAFENILSKDNQLIIKIIFGTLIILGFQILNGLTKKPGYIIQNIFTFLKFLPLIVVVIGGFVLYFSNTSDHSNSFTEYDSEKPFDSVSIFMTMIPIMFAFDGFVYGASLKKDFEHKKVVPPAMLSGIIAVTIFYIVISLGLFFGVSTGSVFDLFDELFKNVPVLSFIGRIIISLTILTMVNGYTSLAPKTVQSANEEKFIYSQNFGSPYSYRKAAIIGGIVAMTVHLSFIGISLLATFNQPTGMDSFFMANLMSDSTTVVVFTFYFSLVVGALINRKTKKVAVDKIKGAFVCGLISIISFSVIMAYIYYDFLILSFVRAFKDDIKFIYSPIVLIALISSIMIYWTVNEYFISINTIYENKFAIKLNPRNWHKKLDIQKETEKIKERINLKKEKRING